MNEFFPEKIMHIFTLNIYRIFPPNILIEIFMRRCVIREFYVILPRCFDEGIAKPTPVRETGVNPVQLPLL